jgi:hypothetical protein
LPRAEASRPEVSGKAAFGGDGVGWVSRVICGNSWNMTCNNQMKNSEEKYALSLIFLNMGVDYNPHSVSITVSATKECSKNAPRPLLGGNEFPERYLQKREI